MVQNWEESKVVGMFQKVTNEEGQDQVQSRMYYNLNVEVDQRMVLSLFQEDDIDPHSQHQRSPIEIGLMVFRKNEDNTIQLYQYFDYSLQCAQHFLLELNVGYYILLPRTIGLHLIHPRICNSQYKSLSSLDLSNITDPAIQSFLNSIFMQLDLLLKSYLDKQDLTNFYTLLNLQPDFDLLNKYISQYKYIKNTTFYQFFKEFILKYEAGQNDFKDRIMKQTLGYNEKMQNTFQRNFVFQLYSNLPQDVIVRDSLLTDLDQRATLMMVSKVGKEFEVPRGIKAYYTMHKDVNGYCYVVLNQQNFPIIVTLDSSQCLNMLYSTDSPVVSKLLDPGALEFMQFVQPQPNVINFKRKVKCSWVQPDLQSQSQLLQQQKSLKF